MACSSCNDRGYLLNNKREFTGFCSCSTGNTLFKNTWERFMSSTGIPREYHHKEAGELFPQVNILHKDFVARTHKNISNVEQIYNTSSVWALYGDSGTGKTFASILVLKAALKLGYSARYITWTALLERRLRHDPNETSITEQLQTVDFLVIDEVGEDSMKHDSKFPNETLDKIIKHRYSNQRPSILVLADEFPTVAKRLPILTTLIGPSAVSEVRGLNYRLGRKGV